MPAFHNAFFEHFGTQSALPVEMLESGVVCFTRIISIASIASIARFTSIARAIVCIALFVDWPSSGWEVTFRRYS